jgi:hypothetical protein
LRRPRAKHDEKALGTNQLVTPQAAAAFSAAAAAAVLSIHNVRDELTNVRD